MARVFLLALLFWLCAGLSAHAQLLPFLFEGGAEAGAVEAGAAEAAAARAAAAEAAAERAGIEVDEGAVARRGTSNDDDNGFGEIANEGLHAIHPETNPPVQPYANANTYPYNGYTGQQQYPPGAYYPAAPGGVCWTEDRRVFLGRTFDHREMVGQWMQPNGVMVTRWRNVFLNHWRVYHITHCG